MKSFIVSAWVVLIYVGNTLGDLFAGLSGLTDWSQLGWAFGGSTAFVLWEFIEKKQRDGWRRVALIVLGMFIALAATKQVTLFLGWDPALVTAGLGAGSYKLFSLYQKKVDKVEDLRDLKDVTDLKK